MIKQADLSGKIALDANGLNNLRQAAKESSPEAIKATARQFEAMFMNMMLKSMRDATPQDSPFDSEQSRSFTSMLDQQLSQNLATKGMGLTEVLAKQLSKTSGVSLDSATSLGSATSKDSATPETAAQKNVSNLNFGNTFPYQLPQAVARNPAAASEVKQSLAAQALVEDAEQTRADLAASMPSMPSFVSNKNQPNHVKAFQQTMLPAAQEASQASGIPAQYMIGQAALESGWGKHEVKGMDGTQSFNLFGIKATGGWKGKVVEAVTTEYINGEKQKRIEKFRAYDSYADSFKDFANLIRSNPRYDKVIGNGQDINSYAQALQKGGYATDPQYAEKLKRIIQLASAS
ncbi:MAG: flagellar assembly peptidoglycan hydrolase FlgJ [Methylophilaceae bacterium]|nr:flagellar assembly peptidoglycan hydrolase FlgJ [Methylophilaceae bacterium]